MKHVEKYSLRGIASIALIVLGGGALAPILAMPLSPLQSQPAPTTAKTAAPKKPKAAPKSDADIQSCITQRLAAAPKLKTQGLSASVSGGAATLTGNAANAGSKGGAGSIAKSCGATSVMNNITFAKPVKAAKSAAAPASPKKP